MKKQGVLREVYATRIMAKIRKTQSITLWDGSVQDAELSTLRSCSNADALRQHTFQQELIFRNNFNNQRLIFMELINNLLVKQFDDNRRHFIERLKERYGIEISNAYYDILRFQFKGKFKKNGNRTLGFVFVDGIKIWCLYLSEAKCLATAYPAEIEFDINELIKACFPIPVRHFAMSAYETYLEEKKSIPAQFGSEKQAALYLFSKTLFPSLHMDNYKYGSVDMFKVIGAIRNLITGHSSYIEYKIVRKPSIH